MKMQYMPEIHIKLQKEFLIFIFKEEENLLKKMSSILNKQAIMKHVFKQILKIINLKKLLLHVVRSLKH